MQIASEGSFSDSEIGKPTSLGVHEFENKTLTRVALGARSGRQSSAAHQQHAVPCAVFLAAPTSPEPWGTRRCLSGCLFSRALCQHSVVSQLVC